MERPDRSPGSPVGQLLAVSSRLLSALLHSEGQVEMSWWRSLLNLPPKGEHWSDWRRTRNPGNGGRENAGSEWWAHPEGPARQAQGPAYGAPGPQGPASGGVMAPPRRPQPPASRAVP